MRKLFNMTVIALWCGMTLIAQEKPGLIFTEFSVVPNTQANYYEITNVGDTAIDLREFTLRRYIHSEVVHVGTPSFEPRCKADFGKLLDESQAILAPGKSFTVMPVAESRVTDRNSFWFGRNNTRPGYRESADFINYVIEYNWDDNKDRIEFGWEKDSAFIDLLVRPHDIENTYLYWRDTIAVDAIMNVVKADGKATGLDNLPIAGIDYASYNYVMVRKSTVKKSGLDWNVSRGIDASDSEWMTIFHDYNNPWNPSFFTTIGTHGDFSIDFSSEVLTIDHDAKTITVPWGIRKGTFNVALSPSKGIIDEIDFGPGMAYLYKEQSDSASSACMLGDTLWVYAAGAKLETAGYAIIPAAPKAGDAMVLPRRAEGVYSYVYEISGDSYATGSNKYGYRCRYYVSENGEGADSITWIPFSERVDTLFNYLEKAPDATWEIDWVDGLARVDLKEGDKLIVTNGSVTKEYYLSLRPLIYGSDASLSAITWPDVDKDDTGWDSDTIPRFSPTVYLYNIEIPHGSANIPALSFFTKDVNAKVEMKSASSLKGGIEDRTTTITVTSADGLNTKQYRIIFSAEVKPQDLQPYFAEPIVSEFIWSLWWSASFVEIANVGNQPLDLGKYMLAGGKRISAAATITANQGVDSIPHWRDRYSKYIPGKKYSSYQYWINNIGRVVDDPDILPIIEPGKCFVIARLNDDRHFIEGDPMYFDPSMYDVLFSSAVKNQWGEIGGGNPIPFKYIFKILGDSILDGLKAMRDPNDFVLIDQFGDGGNNYTGVIGGVGSNNYPHSTYRRKPSNYLPGTVPTYNTGQSAEESSWILISEADVDPTVGNRMKYLTSDLGNFDHDPITFYMSTVGSTRYLVDDGYKGNLKVKGIVSGTTSASFLDNIIRKDEDQALSLISSSSGLVLGDDEQVASGDTLKVISADGKNTTKYVIELGALDDNALLVAATGSGYTIVIEGAKGTISGIPIEVSIEEVLDNVEVPALAILNVIDEDKNLVPLQALDMSDSTYRKTMLMGKVYFEVVAQNGTTIITYLLSQGIQSSDAWVTSNFYAVNQKNRTIANILKGTNVDILLSNLVPSGNATMAVYDKAGFKRDSGYIVLDDVIGVTSEDGSNTVVYSLRMLGYTPSALAWIKSKVYSVNETTSSVDDIPENTDVSKFLSNIEIPGGAYLKMMDADGAEKTEGVILGTDKLEVISEDLSNVLVYTLNLLVSAHDWALVNMKVKVYPNPVSDILHIQGMEGSCLIELRSLSGQSLRIVQTNDPVYGLSVGSISAGMYILRVTDSNRNTKVFRVVKSE